MRRYLLIVLMLVVPLRVFAAESVGICMMEAKAAAQEQADSMPPDCPDHKQQPASESCDSCQMCMPLAGPDDIAIAPAAHSESSLLISPFAHFRSADAHPILKPPIA